MREGVQGDGETYAVQVSCRTSPSKFLLQHYARLQRCGVVLCSIPRPLRCGQGVQSKSDTPLPLAWRWNGEFSSSTKGASNGG